MELVPNQSESKIINFPSAEANGNIEAIFTPKYNEILQKADKLKKNSSFKPEINFNIYKDLELRFKGSPLRGGVTFNSPFRLVNSHSTCQQCLYSFEIDTYGRGCVHDCVYCYAKAELTVHGFWNKPFPMPADITEIWKVFHTVFETDKRTKWRSIMEQRIPIRIGSMSDSFMFMDKKYGVTKEFLRILDHYKYPYIIFTRSDLVANDEYMSLMNPNLCSIQMSLASIDEELNKLIEPGTPSAKRRLKALEKLTQNGFWTTARLNPFFPIYPDGYFTDPHFNRDHMPEPFNFSSFEMIDAIAAHGIPSVLAGFVRLSSFSLNQIEKAVGRNLREFYKDEIKRSARDFHYSDAEIRAYYERIHAKCLQNGIQFTTCYIGNTETLFWDDQDLWSNKIDCCNVKGRVHNFKNDSRMIPWDIRMSHTSNKHSKPNDIDMLHIPLGVSKPLNISTKGITFNLNFIQ